MVHTISRWATCNLVPISEQSKISLKLKKLRTKSTEFSNWAGKSIVQSKLVEKKKEWKKRNWALNYSSAPFRIEYCMRAKCLFTFNFRLLFNVFKRFDALNYNHFGIHFIIQSAFFIILNFFFFEMDSILNYYGLNLYQIYPWIQKKRCWRF